MSNNSVGRILLCIVGCVLVGVQFLLMPAGGAQGLAFDCNEMESLHSKDNEQASNVTNNATDIDEPVTESDHRYQLLEHLFDSKGNDTRATLLSNFWPRKNVLKSDTIVLATHLSASHKMYALSRQLAWWHGPVSCAVHMKSKSDIKRFFEFVAEYEQRLVNTTFHLVCENDETIEYPHNILRNQAVQNIESDYFIALDVDMVPGPRYTFDLLQNVIRKDKRVRFRMRKNRTLFVLPTFEIFTPEGMEVTPETMLPETKAEMMGMVENKTAARFHAFFSGHTATDFDKWMEVVDGNHAAYYDITKRVDPKGLSKYEPYVMGYRPSIPRYWEGFRGFGVNKISWFQELRLAGYHFAVLRNFWTAHLNHPVAPADQKKNKKHYREIFRPHLRDYYSTKD